MTTIREPHPRPTDTAPVGTWRAFAADWDPLRQDHIATMSKAALVKQYGPLQLDNPTVLADRAKAWEEFLAKPTLTEPAPEPERPETIPAWAAWAAVMRDVEKITKGDRNAQQGFNFRGIDATMNTVGPVLRRHGVVVIPASVELVESERYDTKGGTAMHGVITKHVWNVIGPMGDGFLMETLGQSADSGDKAITKSASVAYRTALLQSLTVPTGDRDPDADAHERTAAPDPRQEQWDRIAGLARYAKQSTEAIRKHYLEKQGHDIDGPDATVEALTAYADRLEAHLKEQAEKLNADQSGNDDPRVPTPEPSTVATGDGSPEPQDQPAAEPNQPEPAEQAPAGTDTAPDPETPAQPRRDPRQILWDDILEKGRANGWTAEQIRADFSVWSTDQPGGPFEIDAPADVATADALTKYALAVRTRKAGTP